MSSRKRSSASDEDEAETESPSAKQRRLVKEDDMEEDVTDEELEEHIYDEVDSDDENAAEAPLKPSKINISGRPAEAGIIKRVYVENFMCHKKLKVDLCPNVNFIYGQNGSGKSAILAAIQICLGAGARRTHRARNLAELIRKESNTGSARISVTLRNEGDDGFQPHIYGNSITVERLISTRAGAGGYKLLDEHGKTKSTSKKDLDAMLDQLNIQVENPVAVLDQEDAKRFLTGRAEDKYAFFTKATDLERMDRTYANVVDRIAELETNRDRVVGGMAGAIANVKRLHQEVQNFTEIEKLEDQVGDARRMQGWAMYVEVKNDFSANEEMFELAQKKVEERKAEVDKFETMGTNEEEQAIKQARLEELTEESNEASDLKRELEQQLKLAQAPLKKLTRDEQQLAKETARAEQRLQQAQLRLAQAREEILKRQAASEKTHHLEEMEACRTQLTQLQEEEKMLRERQSNCLRAYQDLEPVCEEAKQRAQSHEKQIWMVKKKIDGLQSATGNSASIFGGPNAARLATEVQKMNQQNKWNGPVVGPIGSYIKIATGKEKYAALAEHALGNVLDRFIVTNDHDRVLFLKLRREVGCTRECNVFSVSPRSVNGRHRIAPPPCDGVETVASCLTMDNDLVFNTLVDQAKIEEKALGESKTETERLLLQCDNQGKESIRGGSIKEVYFYPKGDVWTVTGGSRSMRSNERQMRTIIGADKSAAIQEARDELAQLETDFAEYKTVALQNATELKEAQLKWNEAKKGQHKAKDAIEKLQDKITNIQIEIDATANVEEVDTAELEEDVNNAEQDLVVLVEKAEAIEAEKESVHPSIEKTKKKVEEVEARNIRIMADLEKAENDLATFMAKAGEREAQKQKAQRKYDSILKKIAEFKETLESKRQDTMTALRQARLLQYRHHYAEQLKSQADGEMTSTQDLTPDDPDDETLDAVEIQVPRKEAGYYAAKVDQLKKKISKEKERRKISNLSPEEAYERYNRANNDLKSKNDQLSTIKDNVESLVMDLNNRKKRWKKFRNHLVNMTSSTFDEFLNLKGSSGDLIFDHHQKTLNLCVQKDNANEETQTNDVKALSGGERSFVTLSLLLALGERLETPFRVMDEFDVFMDAVSRKIALETLIDIALKMEHRQFILITPLDLSNITPTEKVRIHTLKPPARSDAVGGLSQQTLD